MGNVCTPSIARWKAHVVDFLFVITELFSLSLMVEMLELRSRNLSKSAFFEWGWVTFGKYFGWKGTIPSNPHWSGKA